MSGIDLNDKKAFDDSLCLASWNSAVGEYKKFHSIHKSGKKLEDVLSEKELKELREDYGDVVEDKTASPVVEDVKQEKNEDVEMEKNEDVEQQDPQVPHAKPNEVNGEPQGLSGEVETLAAHDASMSLAATMPQAVLGTVQDENLKNIMMSWYYAGYYTGLQAGQQQALKDAAPPKL